jgi:hypothetical protein
MRRRWVWLVLGILVAMLGVAALRFSDVVRLVTVAKLRLATGRAVTIDALHVDLFTGNITVRGLRIPERDRTAFGEIEQIDLRVDLSSLLRGQVRIHDLAIANSTVRVVRLSNGAFNLSDMVPQGEASDRPMDIAVDRFTVRGSTVTFEDRVLNPWRTWRSTDITIEARDVSTRDRRGTADASTIVEGAPVTIRLDDFQLAPAHLRGRITTKGMDLALARLYVPASAPLTLERGRVDTVLDVTFDAKDGTRVSIDARGTDVVAVRPQRPGPAVIAPAVAVQIRDLAMSRDADVIALAHVELTGHGTVSDSDVSPPAKLDLARVRLAADDVTWPVTKPAQVSLAASVKSGGELTATGTARTSPNVADLDVRVTRLALEPWARYIPGPTRLSGVADATFAVHADLDPGRVSARARGQVGVRGVVLSQDGRRLLGAERAEALGIDAEWPSRITIERVRIRRPSAALARDAAGEIDLRRILQADAPAEQVRDGAKGANPAWDGKVEIREVSVTGGSVSWADAAVTPAARFTVSGVDATVGDLTWPLPDALRVQVRADAPHGGRVDVTGRVGIQPVNADVRVIARGVELAPYAGYVPMRGRLTGRTDLDVAVVVPTDIAREPIAVNGRAGLARATLFDGMRAIVAVDRADATGLAVEWPSRIAVEQLKITRPWALVERDANGGLPLRTLVSPRRTADAGEASVPASDAATDGAPAETAVTVGHLVVDGGAARIVDHSVSPAYVEELSRVSLRTGEVGTAAAEATAPLDLKARLGPRGTVALRGAVRVEPLLVDVHGDLTDVAARSLNTYVERFTGWSVRGGRVSTKLRYKVDGDRLDARNEIGLAQLEVARAAANDQTQARIGLPLGMLVTLMKDSRGEIKLPVSVGGRLGDPRFDLSEAIWAAVRTVSIKAVTLPVSWIGRLRVGRDKRIQEVEIDPVTFPAGGAVPTSEGEAQLGRLVAFMRRLPGTKMVVTPVVSMGDIEELKRAEIRRAIAKRAASDAVPPAQAAARLFAEQFPRSQPPATVEEIVETLSRDAEPPDSAAMRLGKERAELARTTLKKAGVDTARLEVHTDAEGVETRGGGTVEFALTEQVRPKRNLLAELLAKLREAFQTATRRLGNDHPAASPLLSPRR